MEVYEDFEGILEASVKEYKGNASRGGHVESFRIGGGPLGPRNKYVYIHICIQYMYPCTLCVGVGCRQPCLA